MGEVYSREGRDTTVIGSSDVLHSVSFSVNTRPKLKSGSFTSVGDTIKCDTTGFSRIGTCNNMELDRFGTTAIIPSEVTTAWLQHCLKRMPAFQKTTSVTDALAVSTIESILVMDLDCRRWLSIEEKNDSFSGMTESWTKKRTSPISGPML